MHSVISYGSPGTFPSAEGELDLPGPRGIHPGGRGRPKTHREAGELEG